ncbi:MAG TPA: FHA domain-containing protein, partial [Gemmataceae bacterium]|nr:FHA domain-containing protein [Gemmataceae bacterium]
MWICSKCRAETPSGMVRCIACHADLTADDHEEIPTHHTKPKLLVLRTAGKGAGRPPARQTDHDGDGPAQTPVCPPLPKFRLRVVRGLRVSIEYPLFEGKNLVGRSDDRPVDIDLRDQEPPDRIWASRQHAVLSVSGEVLTIEDLSSTNGTYVNRHRLMPGSKRRLKEEDV